MALQPGMVLGEDIVCLGSVLFKAGTKLDDSIIHKLSHYGIMTVSVMEEVDFASTHFEKIRYDEHFKQFEQNYYAALVQYKTLMSSFLQTGRQVPSESLLQIYRDLYSTIASGATLLDYLYNMTPNEDELTFTHSLNSALLAGTFADWLALPETDKNNLILSGFYYDIGKLGMPYELLWKPGKLTDEEFQTVRKHPVIGYAQIRGLNLDEHVKNAVIMHHERLDGSGYPYHMTGQKIDLFARYIAIVDTYIAMASPRTYRNAFTPLQILGVFEKDMAKYDVELLIPLMKRIADAQIGSRIQTGDGRVWEVMIIHPNKFSRPILRGDNNLILDLLEHPELEITKMV